MKEQKINLQTTLLAQKNGFPFELTVCKELPALFYPESAPTQSLLQKWLREKHELYVESNPNASGYGWFIDKTNGTGISDCRFTGPNSGGRWDIYEDALEIGLQEALKLINLESISNHP